MPIRERRGSVRAWRCAASLERESSMSKRHTLRTVRGTMIVTAVVAVILGGERFLYELVVLLSRLTDPAGRGYDPMTVTFLLNVPIWLVLVCLFGYMLDRWSAQDCD